MKIYRISYNVSKDKIINSSFGHKINEIIDGIRLTVINKAKQLYPYLRNVLWEHIVSE